MYCVVQNIIILYTTDLERLELPPFHRFPLGQQVQFHPKLNGINLKTSINYI